jgi:hypothetical protein
LGKSKEKKPNLFKIKTGGIFMQSEEQLHVQYLKERAQSIGLNFDEYMLFLIFETLEHASVLNGATLPYQTPWQQEYEQERLAQTNQNPKNESL